MPLERPSVWPFVLALFAVAAVAIIAVTVMSWRQHRRSRQRLNQVLNYRVAPGAQVTDTTEPGFFASFVDDLDHALAQRGSYRPTLTRLAAADLTMRPAAWLLIRVGVILGAGAPAERPVPVGPPGSAPRSPDRLAGHSGVAVLRATRRQKAFQNELPDFLLLLASGLRAGLSFTSALDSAAAEGKGEVARQMRRALGEVQLGAHSTPHSWTAPSAWTARTCAGP